MLNNYDINIMEKDVKGIIKDWRSSVQLWNLAESTDQPTWNKFMKEVTGDPVYVKILNIPTDIVIQKGDPMIVTNIGGPKYTGKCQLHIPIYSYSNDKVGTVPVTYIHLPSDICEEYDIHYFEQVLNEDDPPVEETVKVSVTQNTQIPISDDTIFILDGNINEKWVVQKISHKLGEMLIDVIIRSGE